MPLANTKKLRPVFLNHPPTMSFHPFCGALVAPLLFCGSPPTVGWLVIAVIVDPVNRVFVRRARPHVVYKMPVAFEPSPANRNSAPAVIIPALMFRLSAAGDHVFPALIFGTRIIVPVHGRLVRFASVAVNSTLNPSRLGIPLTASTLAALSAAHRAIAVFVNARQPH